MLFFHCPVSFEAFGCGWNFDVSPVRAVLSMDPVIGAISAGCAIVLKPSEVAPATSALLAKLIPLYLDSSLIRVVEGAIPETQALLQQKWDKIFYTGSYTFHNNLCQTFACNPVRSLDQRMFYVMRNTAEFLSITGWLSCPGTWIFTSQSSDQEFFLLVENSSYSKLNKVECRSVIGSGDGFKLHWSCLRWFFGFRV